ncbi:segregation and condensation protein A [Echinimonas agarilytica]|uniref:Segregation and condensation protein A n=1 Tax=Echinimonas agarilytica TaxID=1215918 RepID=A0AA42B759_9GAMM|nr:segregation/condensation protein A [Echinimonas agarilytica]MCM2679495.1 segregation/condensation protein A [Echinimonas agarilytica]
MTDNTSQSPQMQQQPLPLGYVRGEAIVEQPVDLYIPPDALEVILEAFEGPMDLLLYLIRKNQLDILDLPVLEITHQYMEYIALMEELKLEVAAEYLLMAALLAEIKSRLLLPKHVEEDDEEDDPRAELLRRLQEYEWFKLKAQELDQLPRSERDFFHASAHVDDAIKPERVPPDVELDDLMTAFASILKRAKAFDHHHVEREVLSTRERMAQVLSRLNGVQWVEFARLFDVFEGKAGVVVTFLAILELTKEQRIELTQNAIFAPIHVRDKVQSEPLHALTE